MPLILRPVTWRIWAVTAAVIASYVIAGLFLADNGNAEMWIFRIGITVLLVVPGVVIGLYTWTVRGAWRKNTLGLCLTGACLAFYPNTIPLSWAFWFDNGQLSASWLAWLWVSGPVTSSLILVITAIVVARMHGDQLAARKIDTVSDG